MKFKLDENLGSRTAELISAHGHDVHSISQEGLNGSEDKNLFEICASEGRCLITLDLDFADVLRFPPATGAGVALLRPSRNVSLNLLTELVRSLLIALKQEPIDGRLWVVEVGRIRTHG